MWEELHGKGLGWGRGRARRGRDPAPLRGSATDPVGYRNCNRDHSCHSHPGRCPIQCGPARRAAPPWPAAIHWALHFLCLLTGRLWHRLQGQKCICYRQCTVHWAGYGPLQHDYWLCEILSLHQSKRFLKKRDDVFGMTRYWLEKVGPKSFTSGASCLMDLCLSHLWGIIPFPLGLPLVLFSCRTEI